MGDMSGVAKQIKFNFADLSMAQHMENSLPPMALAPHILAAASGSSLIYVGNIALSWAMWRGIGVQDCCILLLDEHTQQHCLPYLLRACPSLSAAASIVVPSGEQHKDIDTLHYIWQQLLGLRADRRAWLINVGGGVLTDMGGLAAATYKRGIRMVHIPTSLLAQVDASVGGKTGINVGEIKNSVGTFTLPEAVFIDPQFLATLAPRHLLSGFAEMLKHGLIADAAHYRQLATYPPTTPATDPRWAALIAHSLHIKRQIVAADPDEQHQRRILNFGHTIGHALESYALHHLPHAPLLHGEAVAHGMLAELLLSVASQQLSASVAQPVVALIEHWYGKYSLPATALPALMQLIANDKKHEHGTAQFSLLHAIGQGNYNQVVPLPLVERVLLQWWAT